MHRPLRSIKIQDADPRARSLRRFGGQVKRDRRFSSATLF